MIRIRHICDKCGESYSAATPLFRIMVVRSGSGEAGDEDNFGAVSKLDLCEDCKNRIMREANTPDPRKVEP